MSVTPLSAGLKNWHWRVRLPARPCASWHWAELMLLEQDDDLRG
jgi:hypothetical protein